MKNNFFLNIIFFYFIFISFNIYANKTFSRNKSNKNIDPIIAIGNANTAKEKISILPTFLSKHLSEEDEMVFQEVEKIILNNFSFYKKRFNLYTYSNFHQSRLSRFNKLYSPDYDFWITKKTDYLIQIGGKKYGKRIQLTVILYDIRKNKKIITESHLLNKGDFRHLVHNICNQMFLKITGVESIFNSQIVFISDQDTLPYRRIKEVYIMDFDGKGVKRLTHHRGVTLAPAISYDRRYIVYSLILHKYGKKNIDLYIMDLKTKKSELLSSREGINSGAIFSRDGKKIIFTLSFKRNADIYEMDIKTKGLRRITRHYSDDVDPSLAPDGKLLAFLSGRPGRAMIYLMDSRETEKDVRRLSFVGKFHATPRFSPHANELVFSSWVDNRFDLYRIDITGTSIVRLTKNFGSNESPTYSNDGEFIAFSSQRVLSRTKATHDIYVIDRDGDVMAKLTQNLGNCASPRWTK